MGHWTSKADYTALSYRGTVPRTVTPVRDAVEILQEPKQQQTGLKIEAEFPGIKDAGGVIPALKIVKEIERAVKDHRQEFLSVNNVIAIIRSTTQFSLQSWIDSDPADVTNWPDPPHVEFANCTFAAPEDVKRFVEQYGFGAGMVHEPPKSIILGAMRCIARFDEDYEFDAKNIYDPRPNRLAITVTRLQQDQDFLRRHWSRGAQAQTVKQHFLWSPDDINFISGKPKIVISDIWDFILVLFLIDLSKGRLRVCANRSCKRLKYFVQERPDQKYCSTSCKNNMAFHNYHADSSKRAEWNAARRKRTDSKLKKVAGRGRRHPVDEEQV